MDYKVIWDDEALKELGCAVRFIAQNNPSAARKIGETILHKSGTLGAFPQMGKIFRKLNREDVRETPVPPYRIIYHIKDFERSVRILKVWHGARQEPDIK
ncbi:MAG TPA: type II toxin-antitoxin system RelE/ParE family toxin [Verrucomicrobiae bacterium]|nr:type II toxin-antitoxin system RelE/ParE family toxin [Verrucomicrobiae bacterium]